MKYNRGISLIEVMLVVVVTIILSVIVLAPFRSFQDTQAVSNAEDAITALLVDARTKTMSSYNDDRYGIHFTSSPNTPSSQLVLFKGTTYNANAATNVVLNLDSNAKVSSVALNGGGVDLIFNRLTGGTDQYGDIHLEVSPAATIYTRTISVNKAGSITPHNQ